MITLTSVYLDTHAVDILYALLFERTPEANISHKTMPSYLRHVRFVRDEPYEAWYLIHKVDTTIDPPMGHETVASKCETTTFIDVGAIYLTKQREVGIFIFAEHQGKGYGTQAINELRKRHPGRILANVAPTNERSLAFFRKLGARLIQHTFQLPEEVA